MKITKFLLAVGMVMSAGIAHADANCAARDGQALTNNQNSDRQVVADATGTNKGQSTSTGDSNGAKDL